MKRFIKAILATILDKLLIFYEKYENHYLAGIFAIVGLTPIPLIYLIASHWHDFFFDTVNSQGWLVPFPIMLSVAIMIAIGFIGFIYVFEWSAFHYYKLARGQVNEVQLLWRNI